MRILVTGVCGFVGSTLTREIVREGVASEVVGIDNFSRPGSERNRVALRDLGVRVVPGDIRCAADVDGLPTVDWVIDAAANPSVLAGVDGKTSSRQLVEHNLQGTINLLEYCKRHSAGFCLLSTSRVYNILGLSRLTMCAGDDAFAPDPAQEFPAGITSLGIDECYTTSPPVSLYGSTKVASEHLALEYGSTFDFPVWINRCGVMAGGGQFGHPAQGIFAYWIHSFREQESLKYIGFGGHGKQVRDCLHPADLLPLLRKQWREPLETEKPRVLNVSGGIENSMSLAQLSRWCERVYGPKEIQSVATERKFDMPWIVLNPSQATKQWGWSVSRDLESILTEIERFADAHPDWLSISRC